MWFVVCGVFLLRVCPVCSEGVCSVCGCMGGSVVGVCMSVCGVCVTRARVDGGVCRHFSVYACACVFVCACVYAYVLRV